MDTYKIYRMYRDQPGKRHTIKTRLSLEEAQAHCKDPETNSSTARSSRAKRRTIQQGPWFDGYTRE